MNNTEIAKFNMIEQQIRPWEVLDHQVLSTLQQVSREEFVDPAYRGLAYADCQIPITGGVRMLPPVVDRPNPRRNHKIRFKIDQKP